MTTKRNTKIDTKILLIETGIDIMLDKGYNATGLNEVLLKSGVPKGSFYHYFQSKEEFGLAVIDTFDKQSLLEMERTLSAPKVKPLKRIKNYIQEAIERAEETGCHRGCLIAKLSEEMAGQNELFRERIQEIQDRRTETFIALLNEAKNQGTIPKSVKTAEAAQFFLCAFEGAASRAKVSRDVGEMKIVVNLFFSKILGVE
jgi:TetR/AcrR family transcriptional repressor of nem operon